MCQMGLALQCRMTVCQKLPKDFEKKLLNYQWYITNLRKTECFLMGQIANADEMSIYLAMPPNYTLEKLHVGEESCKGGTFENRWMRKASPNSDAGSNC
jgi:hypothetical protein